MTFSWVSLKMISRLTREEIIIRKVKQALNKKFPRRSRESSNVIAALTDMARNCISNGWDDENAIHQFCSEDLSKYRQRLSEVLIFNILGQHGLSPSCNRQGPDFLLKNNGRKIWIEIITPEPKGLPTEWTQGGLEEASETPNNEILLRWTNAIDEKEKKLNGRLCHKTGLLKDGYIQKGVIGDDDIYVIAVNGIDLRGHWNIPNINGISGYPFAVEAVLGVGPMVVHIDKRTLKTVKKENQIRSSISKTNNRTVPVGNFLNGQFTEDRFDRVSAIWALDVDEMYAMGKDRPMVVVHNPKAKNPLEESLLPATAEYICLCHEDSWELTTTPGDFSGSKRHPKPQP